MSKLMNIWYYLGLTIFNVGLLIWNIVKHNPWWFAYAMNAAGIIFCFLGLVSSFYKRRGTL